MGKIVSGVFMPHPPLIVPCVGKESCEFVKTTAESMKSVCDKIVEKKVKTVVVVSPHGIAFKDMFSIVGSKELAGDMANFGVPECFLGFEIDNILVDKICEKASLKGLNLLKLDETVIKNFSNMEDLELDSGAFVPLYYLYESGFRGKIVHITPGGTTFEENMLLAEVLVESTKEHDDVILLGSGDLSHYLKAKPPYGFRQEGRDFDDKIIEYVKENDLKKILSLDKKLIAKAGECGLRSLIVVMSVFKDGESRFYSYEDHFGVGYLVASWENKIESMQEECLPVQIARWALENCLLNKKKELPIWAATLEGKNGVFVSLKKDGKLRGCIGTFLPRYDSLADEIYHNALAAALDDPRFKPVTSDEIDKIEISVDILSAPERAYSIDELDEKKYGVIVVSGNKRGLLLPDLEGVDSVEEQLSIAMQKAGITQGTLIDVYKFKVTRYEEQSG